MNRSLTNRIIRACGKSVRRIPQLDNLTVWGEVDVCAIFPKDFFLPFGPETLQVKLGSGRVLRPVMPGLWWAPDDPTKPLDDGLAMVALQGWETDDESRPGRVYTLRIEHGEDWFYPDIHTLVDKKHKIQSAETATYTEDPAIYRAATEPFRQIMNSFGFVPSMHGWLYGFYGDRWFLPVNYEPGCQDPHTDPELRWLVRYFEALRMYGAEIRVYPYYSQFDSGCPAMIEYHQGFFLMKSITAFLRNDEENWRLFGANPWL